MSLPFHYTFNSLSEVTNRGTQHFLKYCSPFSLKWCFQSSNTWMSNRTGLCLQQRSHLKIHRIQIRRCRRPHLFTPESGKMTLASVLSFSGGVGWSSILLVGERLIYQVFLHLFKCWNQNIVYEAICVDFQRKLEAVSYTHLTLPTKRIV